MPAVSVNYPGLPGDLEIGAIVLIDSGLIRMRVLKKDAARILCEVLTPGTIGSKRHINLPGVFVNLLCREYLWRVGCPAWPLAGSASSAFASIFSKMAPWTETSTLLISRSGRYWKSR